jgi:hypothetical protein
MLEVKPPLSNFLFPVHVAVAVPEPVAPGWVPAVAVTSMMLFGSLRQ